VIAIAPSGQRERLVGRPDPVDLDAEHRGVVLELLLHAERADDQRPAAAGRG
jgi:hypothetical protein